MLQIRGPILFTCLILLPVALFGQKAGYLKTSEMLYYGALHGLENSNPRQVVFEFNNGVKKTFKPGDALEYGIQEGQVKWVSRTHKGENLFYQLLESGKVSLLLLKDGKTSTYYLDKQGELIALEKQSSDSSSYRQVLKTELADCYLTEKTIRLAKYKTANLKYFVSQYNDCLHQPFPKLRIGPTVGIKLMENVIKSKYFPAVPETDESISLGAVIELPVSYRPQILLVAQPSVARFRFSTKAETYNPQTGVVSSNTHYLDHVDLDLPLMLKYRFPFYYASPYIQAGPAVQIGLSTKSYSLTDRIELVDGQYAVTEEDVYVESGALAKSYLGAVFGTGIEIPISPYITGVLGANYSIFTADVETGYNKKRYPEIFLAVTF